MSIVYQQSGVEQKPEGVRFPKRPYFPMMLANGVDAILVMNTGSPECSGKYTSYLPMNCARSMGWHKTDRKNMDSDTSYGCNMTLAEPSIKFFLGAEDFAPNRTNQYFDPLSAVLTTEFEQFSHRDSGKARVKVTTFLTADHLLVECWEVLEAPETPMRFQFELQPAFEAGSCTVDDRLTADDVKYTTHGNSIRFSYSLKQYRGTAASWFSLESSETFGEWERARESSMITPVLHSGDVLVRFTAVIDTDDAPDPDRAMDELTTAVEKKGYDKVLEGHASEWQKYHSASAVNLHDPDLQYQYDLSLYVIRALLDPNTGFLPMGILPYHWQNSMFWDSWYCSMAWLGGNRSEYAAAISRFWKKQLPHARELAQKLKCGGARFNWTLNRERPTKKAERGIQFHNNGVIAIQCGQVWKATGDRDFIEEVFPVIEEALCFLVERLVVEDHDGVTLAECAGPDESTTDRKVNDTWTCAVMVKSIDYYLEAVRVTGREPFRQGLEDLRDKLRVAMDRNVDDNGVLQSFEGGKHPHWGSIIFSLFPEHPALRNTLSALATYDDELDGYDSVGVVRSPCRIFTWAEYRVIHILGMIGDASGWERLKKNAKFSNYFGGIPEQVVCSGDLLVNWFMTSHAAFIWAVQALLMQRQGDELRVFMNVPAGYDELSIRDLVTEDGLMVTAGLKKGCCSDVKVVNTGKEDKRVTLTAPGVDGVEFELGPGEEWKMGNGVV